jgi:hypothetical protein
MAIEEHARGLAAWVDHWATQVLEVGSTCALGGDATWDAVLREHGVTPLPPAERQRHIQEGARRTKGALPIEVRWAIEAVYKRAREAARAMDLRVDTPAEQQLIDGIEKRLVNLVDETTREHLQRVTPPANTTASIFANARATTPNYSALGAAAGMSQMKCKSCGAPRKSTEEIGACGYCGGPIV